MSDQMHGFLTLPAGAIAGWALHHWKAPPLHGAHPEQTWPAKFANH